MEQSPGVFFDVVGTFGSMNISSLSNVLKLKLEVEVGMLIICDILRSIFLEDLKTEGLRNKMSIIDVYLLSMWTFFRT